MDAVSADDKSSPPEGSKRPKRKMKTPFQLEVLEKTYSMEMYPSEATRVGLSEKLDLTDRQLQMWFCHRRLKDKKESVGMTAMKPHHPFPADRRGLTESPREEPITTEPGSPRGSRSSSGSESDSSRFDEAADEPMEPIRYYESPKKIMERRVIACVEAQLGEPLREDGPILGVEFDELPPDAFGAPIVARELQDRSGHSYSSNLYGEYDTKHIKTDAAYSGPLEATESKIRSELYGSTTPSHLYGSPVDGSISKKNPLMYGSGHLPREYGVDGQMSTIGMLPQPVRPIHFSSSPMSTDFIKHNEDNFELERKRKMDEARIGKEVQAHEKKIRKELEKQDILRRKREEHMKKEMERLDRERQKEEQRMMRERLRLEEKFQREEKREMERREKFMQKELIRVERMKQKEEIRKEKEAVRQRAAMERATARRIAKESMELIEDERLELMELAASSKGLPSIVALDYVTLQSLEFFRDALCDFPPKSVNLRMPFTAQPWIDSEENVGTLLMVWKFCVTFADVLGLWPFTLDEFLQSFHDYDSRLLGEIHIAILKIIIKDIEDVVRTPSGGPGTNQYTAVNPEGGHPHIVQGAYSWGFDVHSWHKYLNPSTWPEILRQFALSAGLGPELKKRGPDVVGANEDETKGCEDIVSNLRNGSAAENALAIMQEKGFGAQRRSRHRLTPGTVKYAAYHVLALEGSKGLNVIDIAEKIQTNGLRDLSSSKTPEASISVALSRDPILFERIAPSTYNVRPAYRKDPADAESVISLAKEKIQRYANGFLGQNADEEERDDESDSDVAAGADVDSLSTPSNTKECGEYKEAESSTKNTKDIVLDDDTPLQNGIDDVGNQDEGVELESRSGDTWVQGLTEGEYSDLSIEERLNVLVALVGVANEGNSIRVILEDRMDAANALKKQILAEAQLDKKRTKEEISIKLCDSSLHAEGGFSPLVIAENKVFQQKEESSVAGEDFRNSIDIPGQQNGYTTERSRMQLKSYIGHRTEEMYAYRSLPLGQDRRRNRYWQFVASASSLDPGSGRIFVESTDGRWRLIDSEEAFDALLTCLDTRGIRESHLNIMLQKIEVCFKECLKRSKLVSNMLERNGKEASAVKDETPFTAIQSTNYDVEERSVSFRLDTAMSETEQSNFLKRYNDLQIWTWKECFSSSTLLALAYGKKRCLPLLDLCPSCHFTHGKIVCEGDLSEQCNCEVNLLDGLTASLSNTSPRISLIKSLLALIEVSVPSEALHPSWTEDCRTSWGLKLQNSSTAKDLLQGLTQLECAIKRDCLSADFATTEELFSHCVSSGGATFEYTYPGSVPQIPWIPKTTAAVSLRLLELDRSISYIPNQEPEAHCGNNAETLPLTSRNDHTKDVHKAEPLEFDRHGLVTKETKENLPNTPENKKLVRGKGGRPRAIGSQKGSNPQSSTSSRKPSTKKSETLTETLMQGVESHGRGPRTVRKRRTETLQGYDKSSFKKVVGNKPPVSSRNVELDCLGESDDENAVEDLYKSRKWGPQSYGNVNPAGSIEMREVSENDEMEGMINYDYDLDRDGDGKRDGGFEYVDSGEEDYIDMGMEMNDGLEYVDFGDDYKDEGIEVDDDDDDSDGDGDSMHVESGEDLD